jgi:hypothetical protein
LWSAGHLGYGMHVAYSSYYLILCFNYVINLCFSYVRCSFLILILFTDEADIHQLLDVCGVIPRGDRTKIELSLASMKQVYYRCICIMTFLFLFSCSLLSCPFSNFISTVSVGSYSWFRFEKTCAYGYYRQPVEITTPSQWYTHACTRGN